MNLPAVDTIANLLRFSAEDLHGASDDPRRDAEVLLSSVLDCDRAYFFAYSDTVISDRELDIFRDYVARRKRGEPVAYIVGKREFWSLLLKVDNSTLIPRPDTEVLVEVALQWCKKEFAFAIDLGAGTGAIALALATERPGWTVDAVDAHAAAVALATQNACDHALQNVHVYQSNWFAGVSANTAAPDALFDMVISNPPYIAAADCHLDCGDLRFEPRTALVSADNGYADLFFIAQQARNFLREDGLLLLEHGFEQAATMRNYLLDLGYSNVQTIKDYGGNERVAVARWHSKRP